MVLGALLALANDRLDAGAGDPKPPEKPIATLKPLLSRPLPKHLNLKEPVAELMKQFLGKDADARSKAEAALLQKGPMLAVSLQAVWLEEIKDPDDRARLLQLSRRALLDSPQNAQLILRHAQAIHSVADGIGPLKFEPAELAELRLKAKLFHYFFVDPKVYAKQVEAKNFGDTEDFTPSVDLPQAMALYRMAGDMYGRLAKAEKDVQKARQFQAEQARCQREIDGIEKLRPFP
jgi:hypothetical protein